jgi:3-dehydroquinate synthetase
MAEVIKSGIIGDPQLFNICEHGLTEIKSRWAEVISRAIAVKVRVVNADPYERGERAVLNLGHTLGHTLELSSGFTIRHGEAVAIGMVAAAELSVSMGLAEATLPERIAHALSLYGLPVSFPPGLDIQSILAGMKFDKKRSNGKLNFVLPIQIGQVQYGIPLQEEQICALF